MKPVMQVIMAQWKQLGSKFKAKGAIEAIKNEKTLNQIASIHCADQNQVLKRKKKALERLPEASYNMICFCLIPYCL